MSWIPLSIPVMAGLACMSLALVQAAGRFIQHIQYTAQLRADCFSDIRCWACSYRKSDPDVLMMQSTEERLRLDASDRLSNTLNWRILVQR